MAFYCKKTKSWAGDSRVVGAKRKTKTGFKTKAAARKWERKRKEDIKNPPPPLPEELNISEACLEYISYSQKRHQLNTYRQKQYILTSLVKFINDDDRITDIDSTFFISELSTNHITKYLDSVYEDACIEEEDGRIIPGGKKANRDLREIKTWFNWLSKHHDVRKNPVKAIEKYREPQFKKYVPPQEHIKAIIKKANPFEKDIIQVAYHSLARAGEIRRMKVSDCDFSKRTLTLWTRKRRGGGLESDDIEMNDTLYQLLKRRCNGKKIADFVFPDPEQGDKLRKKIIDTIMPALCHKAEVSPTFTLHSIRHHVAALLATKLPLIEIQKLLRHKRASTTDTYLRSLVTIKTKGIYILDDLDQDTPDNVVPFADAVNR